VALGFKLVAIQPLHYQSTVAAQKGQMRRLQPCERKYSRMAQDYFQVGNSE